MFQLIRKEAAPFWSRVWSTCPETKHAYFTCDCRNLLTVSIGRSYPRVDPEFGCEIGGHHGGEIVASLLGLGAGIHAGWSGRAGGFFRAPDHLRFYWKTPGNQWGISRLVFVFSKQRVRWRNRHKLIRLGLA